jgi:hypothetical protein
VDLHSGRVSPLLRRVTSTLQRRLLDGATLSLGRATREVRAQRLVPSCGPFPSFAKVLFSWSLLWVTHGCNPKLQPRDWLCPCNDVLSWVGPTLARPCPTVSQVRRAPHVTRRPLARAHAHNLHPVSAGHESAYEEQRRRNIAANQATLVELGIGGASDIARGPGTHDAEPARRTTIPISPREEPRRGPPRPGRADEVMQQQRDQPSRNLRSNPAWHPVDEGHQSGDESSDTDASLSSVQPSDEEDDGPDEEVLRRLERWRREREEAMLPAPQSLGDFEQNDVEPESEAPEESDPAPSQDGGSDGHDDHSSDGHGDHGDDGHSHGRSAASDEAGRPDVSARFSGPRQNVEAQSFEPPEASDAALSQDGGSDSLGDHSSDGHGDHSGGGHRGGGHSGDGDGDARSDGAASREAEPPDDSAHFSGLRQISCKDVDGYWILHATRSALSHLKEKLGWLSFKIGERVGDAGLQAQRRGHWDTRVFASLGPGGGSMSDNPFWMLFNRNDQGDWFEEDDHPELGDMNDAGVNVNLMAMHSILTDPSASRAAAEPNLLRRPPRSESMFSTSLDGIDLISEPSNVGRYLDAAMSVGAHALTGFVGTRADWTNTLITSCIEAGSQIQSMDVSMEVPYSAAGIQVYKARTGPSEGRFSVTWKRAFDGKPDHRMWVYNSGSERANCDALARASRRLMELDGRWPSSFDIVASWAAGQRPCRVEVTYVFLMHVKKAFEYSNVHHITKAAGVLHFCIERTLQL